jgi:hypothetical protein
MPSIRRLADDEVGADIMADGDLKLCTIVRSVPFGRISASQTLCVSLLYTPK